MAGAALADDLVVAAGGMGERAVLRPEALRCCYDERAPPRRVALGRERAQARGARGALRVPEVKGGRLRGERAEDAVHAAARCCCCCRGGCCCSGSVVRSASGGAAVAVGAAKAKAAALEACCCAPSRVCRLGRRAAAAAAAAAATAASAKHAPALGGRRLWRRARRGMEAARQHLGHLKQGSVM